MRRDADPRGDRDWRLLIAALVGCGLWLGSIGPARTWAAAAGARDCWVTGVAPSFLAAMTFALWQSFATRTRPLTSALYAAALIVATEIAQLFLSRYTADVWDAVAGIVGAALALPVLRWRERQRGGERRRAN